MQKAGSGEMLLETSENLVHRESVLASKEIVTEQLVSLIAVDLGVK